MWDMVLFLNDKSGIFEVVLFNFILDWMVRFRVVLNFVLELSLFLLEFELFFGCMNFFSFDLVVLLLFLNFCNVEFKIFFFFNVVVVLYFF